MIEQVNDRIEGLPEKAKHWNHCGRGQWQPPWLESP